MKRLAILLAVIGVMLFNDTQSHTATYPYTWGVQSEDAFYYYISEEIDNEDLGVDYVCNAELFCTCAIQSSVFPDLLGRIPKQYAVRLMINSRFEDLDPFR